VRVARARVAGKTIRRLSGAIALAHHGPFVSLEICLMSLSPCPEKFSGASTVSLTVHDIHKSLAWYRDVLGMGVTRFAEVDGKLVFVALKAGGLGINLNQDDGKKGWDRTKGLGFSINISVTDDIDAIAARIKASGGTLDAEPVDAPWGARYFPMTDPDGYKLGMLKWLK
jgi:uncharacterized glyoxalase superfamily protein PhnB